MEDKSTIISENEDIKALIKALSENEMNEPLSNLFDTLEYINTLENQLNTIMYELKTVKEQMSKIQENPIKESIKDLIQNIDNKLEESKKFMYSVKNAIIDGAKQTIDNIKQKGILTLNEVLNFLHVKDGVKVIKDILKSTENQLNKIIKDLEHLEQEVKETQKPSVIDNLNDKKSKINSKEPTSTSKKIKKEISL